LITKKEEELKKAKRQLLYLLSPNGLIVECGNCVFYNNRGLCTHVSSTCDCADRDSDYECDIDRFKARDKK